MARPRKPSTVRLRVLSPVEHDGIRYPVGAELEVLPDDAEPLIAAEAARRLAPQQKVAAAEERADAAAIDAIDALQAWLSAAELDPRIQAAPSIAALVNDLYHSLHEPDAFLRSRPAALGLSRIVRAVQHQAGSEWTAVARSARVREKQGRRESVLRKFDELRAASPRISESALAQRVAVEMNVATSTVRGYLRDRRKKNAGTV